MAATFPHSGPIRVGDLTLTADAIIEHLGGQLTERRRARIDAVVAARIYSIVPVLDGLYDRGNVSAVMRTAEGLGFGEMHVIETMEDFKAANRVTQGADKWLDVRKWDAPSPCVADLRARGFQVIATSLEAATPLDEVDFRRPTALVFGNERDGVSREVLDAADARVILPMSGFAQSFNISVAAALMLYHARCAGAGPDLDSAQQELLRARYFLKSVEHPEALLRRALGQDALTQERAHD